MTETFESGISPAHWEQVTGGNIGLGCKSLLPHAHGKTLYFNQCGRREAITVELDTTKSRFVSLQIHQNMSIFALIAKLFETRKTSMMYKTQKALSRRGLIFNNNNTFSS